MAAARRARAVKSSSSTAQLPGQRNILSFFKRTTLQSSPDTPPASVNTTPASAKTAPASGAHYTNDGAEPQAEPATRRSRDSTEAADDLEELTQILEPEQETKAPTRRYRDSTEAPDNFKEQTQILFEENIYNLAIQSLQTNLFSQSYCSSDSPWWVAPPTHIAFLGTLVIHPSHTTWAKEDGKNKKIVAVRAHQYLLDVLRSVGPVNGHFKTAFAFRDRSSRADRRRRHSPDEDDTSRDDHLDTPLANEDSIWNRVPDFWTMLGWAFSCAVSHPERWVHWKLWVELLLDVLERDLKERIDLDGELDDKKYSMLKDSMIMSYIGEHQLGHIMRVLFAYIDGDSHSYKEIWPRETLSPTATNKRKRDKQVDLENDEYGDWFESEDEPFGDEDVEGATTSAKTTKKRGKGGRPKKQKRFLPIVESPLLEETIPIRRRIFALISQLCYELPDDDAPFDVFNLYERFAEHIRGLPLDVFPHFVWSEMPVIDTIYVTLARHVLSYLLPPGVPQPKDVDKETDTKGFVSAVMMEQCFLPFATNSVVEDNAKLAVVLWELFSFLWQHPNSEVCHDAIPQMREAILAGLEAREKKSRMKNEAIDDGMVESRWANEKMGLIEKDRHAPVNVLRLAHSKFRLLLEKSEDADLTFQADKDSLEADFLGWK